MHDPSRREAVVGTLAAFLAACRESGPLHTGTPLPAEFLGLVPFVGEDGRTLDALTGEGLDGRLITDLSVLEAPEDLVMTNARFYVRTAASSLLDPSGWTVAITGRVVAPDVLDLAALHGLAAPQGVLQ